MKKLVIASVLALASLSLAAAPKLQAQDSGQSSISIKDPAEFNAYQMFYTQTNPKAKAEAGEEFLKKYPQSVAKTTVLQQTMEAYQQAGDQNGVLSAASQLLQVDPNNVEAIYFSVALKKAQCGQTSDKQTCDDAAALAQRGLAVPKPAAMSADEWKKSTDQAYPLYHSAIALDNAISKKDWKGAQEQYTEELKMYNDQQSKTIGLADTLFLAQAYSQPGSAQDLVKATWFYARVWDFAPPSYKAQIEPKLEYYYKKYHGGLDGLDQIKQQAQSSTFPPDNFTIAKAKSPQEQIHDLIAQTPDLSTLALADKETILAMGSKDDADKMWSLLQGKQTQVPGTVIQSVVSDVKVVVPIVGRKPEQATVHLKNPMGCADFANEMDVQAAENFISTNGVPDDTAKLSTLFTTEGRRIRKITIEPEVSQIKMAVTQDAKATKVPDFLVNLKTPVSCKDIPPAGQDFSNPPAAELVGTYATYRQLPATDTTSQAAEIVLNDGQVIPAEKKAPARRPVRRPAGHRPSR
ncbi:MAG: hypothetical protein ACLGSD_02470 [Acidobacteriota bacterium]